VTSKRTALITGSTSGIGRGIAVALGRRGHHFVRNGCSDAAETEALRWQLQISMACRCDTAVRLSQLDQVEIMLEATIDAFGGADVLVKNAGIQFVAPVDEFPVDKWDAIWAINLSACFHTVRLALPRMKSRGWGRLIKIASAHALAASPFKSAYVAAKHGIAGWTKTLAPAHQPTKKFLTMEEVAALTSLLISDAASSVTGAILPLNGAWTAQ
jgi:3-hydroxybutyrate dehydrogenase